MRPSDKIFLEELEKLRNTQIRSKWLQVPEFLKSFKKNDTTSDITEEQKNSPNFFTIIQGQGSLNVGMSLNIPKVSEH